MSSLHREVLNVFDTNSHSTGLTIPLQITLSNIRLSAFIILVFSKQKGITLVFRNDPLESLKVSSTFDSIPFVRDYLQRTIDAQLRVLFMDELPAIIHRLSLRLWVPEYRVKEDEELASGEKVAGEEAAVDPFSSPPQDPVDSTGNILDASEIASLSLDSGVETQSLFSRKNLVRLATLTDSQRTLSLFTPSIKDTVFRAWAGATEREGPGISSPTATPALSRTHSYSGSASTIQDGSPLRPGLQSVGSGVGLSSMGGGRHSKAHAKKRKRRVVNLRKKADGEHLDVLSEDGESVTISETASDATSAPSVFTPPPAIAETREEPKLPTYAEQTSIAKGKLPVSEDETVQAQRPASFRRRPIPEQFLHPDSAKPMEPIPTSAGEKAEAEAASSSSTSTRAQIPNLASFLESSSPNGNGSSILEQAWLMKMAGEVARRMQEEKSLGGGMDSRSESWREQSPPPVYSPSPLGI